MTPVRPEDDPLVAKAVRGYLTPEESIELVRRMEEGDTASMATVEDLQVRMASVIAAVREDIERATVERCLPALDAIVLHGDMPDGESWEQAYNEVVEMAREAAARLREGGRDA